MLRISIFYHPDAAPLRRSFCDLQYSGRGGQPLTQSIAIFLEKAQFVSSSSSKDSLSPQ
jgi:hypothetical protein